jgi:hypothetical protein
MHETPQNKDRRTKLEKLRIYSGHQKLSNRLVEALLPAVTISSNHIALSLPPHEAEAASERRISMFKNLAQRELLRLRMSKAGKSTRFWCPNVLLD